MTEIREFTGDLVEHFRGITAADIRALWPIVGRCPNEDGDVRENTYEYGCTSWTDNTDTGCGFAIWKTIQGRSISPREAATLLAEGITRVLKGFRTQHSRGRLVLIDGQIHLLDENGVRLDLPVALREVVAVCPKCRADVKANNAGFGCVSWQSRRQPGCGFVIWRSVRGHQVTTDEAHELIIDGRTRLLGFDQRRNTFQGRLVLNGDLSVGVEDADGTLLPAPVSRKRAPPIPPTARPPIPRSRPPRTPVMLTDLPAMQPTDDLFAVLALHSLEVVDRRSSGGSLWVIGGPELTGLIEGFADGGLRFAYAQRGAGATGRRPGWWTRGQTQRGLGALI
jgi:hypothetical protein